MNNKRIIALFVTFMLVISTIVTVSAAAFPDITDRHSWAGAAIDDMVSRGILKGYTDGTFKPDRAVTHLETLIIAARIMGVDESGNEEYRSAALKEYSDILAPYNIDYKNEIAYLLYCGVITQSDLPSYISDSAKDQALKRYEAAILLTKLVGGEEDALNNSVIVIDYADASSIPSSAKAHVKYISDIGLMNGMENNKFGPDAELTRAMISTIMYRAENYMKESVVTGTVTAVSGSSLSVTINGSAQEIAVPENTLIKIDGKTCSVSDISVNQLIRIHYQDKDIRFIDAVTSNLYYTISGTITAVSESAGVKKITIVNSAGTQTFPINTSACTYLVNNVISTYADITKNVYATLTIQSGSITKISVETGSKTVTGKIKSITINETVAAVTVETNSGDSADYVFNENAVITRNGSNSDIHSLAAGDSVTVTITNGGISKLAATSSSRSISGTISKIVISSEPKITIKTAADETEYGITSSTSFVIDGNTDGSIYDLRLGASAEVRLDSTNITSITTQSLVVSPTLTGIITYVHPTSYVMGLQVTDASTGETKTIQTVVKSSVKVTDTTSSRITSFKALEPGMTVVVVGTSNYGVYEVSQIIVTAQ